MRFYLHIDCDNDAFGGSPALASVEVGRILADIGSKLAQDGQLKGHAWDANGNRCGVWRLDDRPSTDPALLADMLKVTRQAVADYEAGKGRRDAR
jgi:hypothetical protein